MKRANIQVVPFRRKREGKTNYRKRIKLVASRKHRLVVRKSLTQINAQLISFDVKGDVVAVGVSGKALIDLGWSGSTSNIPAAYMVGFIAGKKALANGIKEAVFDLGFHTSLHGAKVFAALKGAIDAGLDVPSSEDAFPSEDRLNGKHIKDFANNLEELKKKAEQ